MRRGLQVACIVVALAALSVDSASAAGGRLVKRCTNQSFAGFPRAYENTDNLVVGPLAWIFARKIDYDGSYKGIYRWKLPVLVLPGRTVTIRIGAAAQGFAGLSFGRGGWGYEASYRTVVFRSCSHAKAGSVTSGRRVTFWSGGVTSTRSPACVPVDIRINRGAVRHRTLGLAGADC